MRDNCCCGMDMGNDKMIMSNIELLKVLADHIKDGDVIGEIMEFVVGKDLKKEEEIKKWVDNCDKLMKKLK